LELPFLPNHKKKIQVDPEQENCGAHCIEHQEGHNQVEANPGN
jgi:hypothetical protein